MARGQIAGPGHVRLGPRPVERPPGEERRERPRAPPQRRRLDPRHGHARAEPERQRVGDGVVPARVGGEPSRLRHHVAVEKHQDGVRRGARARVSRPGKPEPAPRLAHHLDVQRRRGRGQGLARAVVDDDDLEQVAGVALALQRRERQRQRPGRLEVRHHDADRARRRERLPRLARDPRPVVVAYPARARAARRAHGVRCRWGLRRGRGGAVAPGLRGARATRGPQRAPDAQREQLEVEPRAHRLDVAVVVAELVPRAGAVGAPRLRQARDAGPHPQAFAERGQPALDARGQLRALRPRTHQAHLAPQHVQHLRQLVEMEPAQHAAHRGGARIPPHRPDRPGAGLRALDHGAELEHREHPAVAPEARLAVQHRAGALEPDRERDADRHNRPERQQPQPRQRHEDEIEGALVALPGQGARPGGGPSIRRRRRNRRVVVRRPRRNRDRIRPFQSVRHRCRLSRLLLPPRPYPPAPWLRMTRGGPLRTVRAARYTLSRAGPSPATRVGVHPMSIAAPPPDPLACSAVPGARTAPQAEPGFIDDPRAPVRGRYRIEPLNAHAPYPVRSCTARASTRTARLEAAHPSPPRSSPEGRNESFQFVDPSGFPVFSARRQPGRTRLLGELCKIRGGIDTVETTFFR